MFIVPDMVLTFAFVNVKLRKYLLARRIVCVVAQSALKTKLYYVISVCQASGAATQELFSP